MQLQDAVVGIVIIASTAAYLVWLVKRKLQKFGQIPSYPPSISRL